ncbi:MAG: HupE/UreJ family protein [Deltaproteobacteria bacterium]|nr:HupE/UreJ family protein [Deltaproteobacteria bacterium]
MMRLEEPATTGASETRKSNPPGLQQSTTRLIRPLRGVLLAALWVIFALTSVKAAHAHNIGESYLYLQVYQDTVTGRFEVALSDFNHALELTGTELEITPANLDQKIGFLQDYYLQHVRISQPQGPLSIDFTEHRVLDANGGYALLSFDLGGLQGVPKTLTFDYSVLLDEEPDHRGFLLVEHNWATGTFANENRISAVFGPDSRRQEFDLTTTGRLKGFLAVVRLGIEHIWEGVDHILFLVALLLPAVLRREDGKWQPVERFTPALVNVVKIVTAFTVAHSVTLSLASLGVVDLPGRLVEVIIAGSIAIAAADLLFPVFRGRVWLIVVGFGLFHGFGFAGALSEMGILREHLGLSLLAFNLGVEIGQIVIVAALVPILFLLRRQGFYRKLVLPVAAVLMILVSSAWVIERAFDVDLPIRELLPSAVQKVIP